LATHVLWEHETVGSSPTSPTIPSTAPQRAMLPSEPSESDIEDLVFDALERLPPPFRERLGSVAIVVEEEASPEQLASVGAHGLYGLYQGVPRTSWAADQAPLPSKITIFRGPLVRANRTPDRLAAAVEETVYHEIAHHLGISDARLHELGGVHRSSDRTSRPDGT
jgi:predicted Zn-dependent protease with MMP-like domain